MLDSAVNKGRRRIPVEYFDGALEISRPEGIVLMQKDDVLSLRRADAPIPVDRLPTVLGEPEVPDTPVLDGPTYLRGTVSRSIVADDELPI
jgi:hypothetical protein